MYEKEFIDSVDRKEFVRRIRRKRRYKITTGTATRAFYRVRKKLGEDIVAIPIKKKINNSIIIKKKLQKPDSSKMLHLWQLKDNGVKITEKYLIKNFYSKEEIAWLKKKGEL